MISNTIDTTIIAPATAPGGAVAMIRMSGPHAIDIAERMFRGRHKLSKAQGYTLHYGAIVDAHGEHLDDVVIALFRAPHSYTGDDTVEITLHGSEYITSSILNLAVEYGATPAAAGEFTRRAFLAGKMDLSRAEAVADIIASDSQWSHRVATTQMRGGYSEKLQHLRSELVRLCSLLELELDFSEEEVEFADREQLAVTLKNITSQIEDLRSSFALGNALKNGVNVAIVGKPNVGKSTLLNALVNEDRAMVSDIAGTTRDTIEATTVIDGIRFRFIDTAGLRTTDDSLEQMGIERTLRATRDAHIVVHLATAEEPEHEAMELTPQQHYIKVINKIDRAISSKNIADDIIAISAKCDIGIDSLREALRDRVNTSGYAVEGVMVSNARHYAALTRAYEGACAARDALRGNVPSDLVAEDLRIVLHHLGEITGEVTSEDILHSIFSNFCIGK